MIDTMSSRQDKAPYEDSRSMSLAYAFCFGSDSEMLKKSAMTYKYIYIYYEMNKVCAYAVFCKTMDTLQQMHTYMTKWKIVRCTKEAVKDKTIALTWIATFLMSVSVSAQRGRYAIILSPKLKESRLGNTNAAETK
jgi:hypothetical protein